MTSGTITRGTLLYEGKAKRVYATADPDLLLHEFKDSATAFNAEKKGEIVGKGEANARISAALFGVVDSAGVPTHLRSFIAPNQLLTERLEMIPLEVVVRNRAAGSLAKRLGYPEGGELRNPVVEFYFKDDSLGDPLVNADHVSELQAANERELETMRRRGLQVNTALRGFLVRCGLELIDFKLEFGRQGTRIVLGDEISPDTCRLWDTETQERLDKDRFRRDLGGVEEAYQEVLRRVEATR